MIYVPRSRLDVCIRKERGYEEERWFGPFEEEEVDAEKVGKVVRGGIDANHKVDGGK